MQHALITEISNLEEKLGEPSKQQDQSAIKKSIENLKA